MSERIYSWMFQHLKGVTVSQNPKHQIMSEEKLKKKNIPNIYELTNPARG